MYQYFNFASNVPSSIDLEVKIIYYEGEKDIIGQYILFTRIYDEQKNNFDDERLAVKETIQICKDENVLSGYIEKYDHLNERSNGHA